MKDPWVAKIPCCCCCWGSSKSRPQRSTKLDSMSLAERGEATTDANQAERAINSALRLSFHSSRDEEDKPTTSSEPPPPSYDTVLKDDDRRTPRAVSGDEIQPQRSPVECDDRKLGAQNQNPGSVFSSSGESDVVLTPPTTAPPTVIDEDSGDDERFYPGGGRSGR